MVQFDSLVYGAFTRRFRRGVGGTVGRNWAGRNLDIIQGMEMRRYRNGSHKVRGNARRPFRHVRRIQWWFVHAFIETDLCGKKGYFPSEEKVPNPDVDDKGGVVPESHPEGTGSEKSRCVDVDCHCLDEAKLCEKIKKSESDGSWDGDDWGRIFHNCAHWVDMILKSQECKDLEEHFPGYNLPPAWPRY